MEFDYYNSIIYDVQVILFSVIFQYSAFFQLKSKLFSEFNNESTKVLPEYPHKWACRNKCMTVSEHS